MFASRSAKVLVLSSGHALTSLVGIVSAAILARIFSQNDYASYRQTLLAYTVAVPFVLLGFDRALYHFLPGEEKRSRGVLVENLIWLVGAGTTLSIFLLAGGSGVLAARFNNPDIGILLLLMAPYPLLMLPTACLGACLMSRNRTEHVAAFHVASRLLLLLAIVVPCLVWRSPSTAILGMLFAGAVTTAVAMVLMFHACNAGTWHPTISGLKKQAQLSLPLGLSTLIGTISLSLDQVLVAAVCAPADFAIYVNGAMEIPIIGIVTGSVTSVLMVDYARLHKEARQTEIVALIHRSMLKCALIVFPTMIFLMCMAPEMMSFIYGKAYEASSIPFRIYLLMLPVRILTFGAVLQATGHGRNILISSILSVGTNAVLLWCAIQLLGFLFAPVGAVISLYLIVVPYLILVLRSMLQCSVAALFPWRELGKVMMASCAALPLLLLGKHVFTDWPDAATLISAALVYGVATVSVFFWLGYGQQIPWRNWTRKHGPGQSVFSTR